MKRELRRIHTFDACHPIAEIPALTYEQRVFKYIASPGHPGKKEVRTDIFRTLIIAKTSLPFIPADNIEGFHTGSAHILHMEVFQVPVRLQLDPDDHLITRMQYAILRNRVQD